MSLKHSPAKEAGSVCKTISIEEAAKVLGIGRNQGYEAARRGQIPVIRIGKRVLVPVAALDQMLAGEKA